MIIFVLLQRKITLKPSWSPSASREQQNSQTYKEKKRLPNVNSCNEASAAMSGVNSIFSLGHGCYRQAGIPATDGAVTGVNTSTGGATNGGGGGDFEAAQRLATVQSCQHHASDSGRSFCYPKLQFKICKETLILFVQLKKVMFEWWLKKQRGTAFTNSHLIGEKVWKKKLRNDICSPAITVENVITMIQNSIITPFAFIFLYSFII